MKLSYKINLLLIIVSILFTGLIVLLNDQYKRLNDKKIIGQTIKQQIALSQSEASEIISNLILDQNVALSLFLEKIKTQENLEDISLISDDDFQTIIRSQRCLFHEVKEACVMKNYNLYTLYYKLQYGNGEFGALKKTFQIGNDVSLFTNIEIFKLLIILIVFGIVIFAILSNALNRIVVSPLKDICKHIQPLARGEFDVKIPKQETEELRYVADSIYMISQKLQKYQKEIERNTSLAAIGSSTAMVAHDVRKPLTSMRAMLRALPAIKDDSAQLNNMIAAVDTSIARTNAMLNEIMDFSRDSTALELKDCDPQGLIVSAVTEVLRNHPDSNVEIQYNLNHLHVLRVDSARIIRVLANILDNSIGAMESEQESTSVGKIWITTNEPDGADNLTITLADNGPGIPEECLPKIFDPFFTKGKKGGTGLGLAICQKIISMHGGKIAATSRSKIAGGMQVKGAAFVLELPLGADRVSIKKSELINSSAELKPFREEEAMRVNYGDTTSTAEFMRLNKERGRKSYLLIVDDEPLFRETLRGLVNQSEQVRDHVHVIEVESGETALKVFEGREFDYVIADIDLGRNRMNGYKLTKIILEKYPNTHVLIHSNKRKGEMDEEVRRLSPSRFMGFLPKPMTSSELLQFLACKTFEAGGKKTVSAFSEFMSLGVANPQTQKPINPKTVLLLNDDASLLFGMKIDLKPHVQVLDAMNVSDAIRHLTKNKIDVIFSDINLGDGLPDGYDFLKEVRARNKDVPFIFMSGYAKDDEWSKAQSAGATDYLQLPFDIKDMLKMVGDHA